MGRRIRHYQNEVTLVQEIHDMTTLRKYYPTLPKFVWQIERWKHYLPMYIYREDGEEKLRIDEKKCFSEIV